MSDDWKESAIKRRDERHTKMSDEPVKSMTPSKKKKNTKKWCKGKEGVEHQPECRKYNELKRSCTKGLNHWRVLICTKCGKELDRYYGQKNKPEWVDK